MKWGGPECCLFQMSPKFHLIESNPNMAVCNVKDRSIPRGLQFGSRFVHVEVDDGLDKLKSYGVPAKLDWIQIIGCGKGTALQSQMEYRKLTVEDARKQRDKKLHADDFGVDTKILDWGLFLFFCHRNENDENNYI